MIVRDEAYFLTRCLEAVRDHVDEIVIVDTGSKDDTISIANRFTTRVCRFDWCDDFAAARNYSLEQATGDWVLVLDADEILLPDDFEQIYKAMRDAPSDVYFLQQLNYSNEPMEPGWQRLAKEHPLGWPYQGYVRNPIARLFRRREDIRYVGKVHEVVDEDIPGVRYEKVDIVIHHDYDGNPHKSRNNRQKGYLDIMEHALKEGADGRLASYAGRVRMYHMQDYSGAIERFRQAIALDHNPDENLSSMAEAYYRLNDFESARNLYAKLYQRGFRQLASCNNYANLLVKAKDYKTAVEVLETTLKLPQITADWEQTIRKNINYLKKKVSSHAG